MVKVSSVPKKKFTAAEIGKHRNTIDTFSDAAADFLNWVYADHRAFFQKWGVFQILRQPQARASHL
jgi:hypothetical protein